MKYDDQNKPDGAYLFQVQQKKYRSSKPDRWREVWSDINVFDSREKALERHRESDSNSRVVELVETDSLKNGEVAE